MALVTAIYYTSRASVICYCVSIKAFISKLEVVTRAYFFCTYSVDKRKCRINTQEISKVSLAISIASIELNVEPVIAEISILVIVCSSCSRDKEISVGDIDVGVVCIATDRMAWKVLSISRDSM